MRFRLWSFVHDVAGSIECWANDVRMRAIRGMSDATDWDEYRTSRGWEDRDDWDEVLP